MKKKQMATVISQEKLIDGVYSMWIKTDGIAREAHAGQFISIYTKDKSRLLPRPISLCQIDQKEDRLRIVYRVAGAGTKEFSNYRAGESIAILGPLGNGYTIDPSKPVVLVAGGIGVPPIVEAAKTAKECGAKNITIVLGYRDQNTFLLEELKEYGQVIVATDDGSLGVHGTVIDAMEDNKIQAGVIYACGPTPMLKGLQAYAEKYRMESYLSLEERMACGIGACLACVVNSTEVDHHSYVKNKRICTDGPVFSGREIEF